MKTLSSKFWKIIAAGTPVLNRLRYAQKFALISLLAAVPVAVLMYFMVSDVNAWVDFAAKERVGLKYIDGLERVMIDMMQHRGQSLAVHTGGVSLAEDLKETDRHLSQAIEEMNRIDTQRGRELEINGEWAAIREEWQRVLLAEAHATPEESFVAHTRVINDVRELILHAGDTSNLITDPDLDSYYLMDTVITKIPPALETLGELRARATQAAVCKKFDSDERVRIELKITSLKAALKTAERGIQIALKTTPALNSRLAVETNHASAMALVFASAINLLTKTSDVSADPAVIFAQGTKAIDTLNQFSDTTTKILDELLIARIARLTGHRNGIAALVSVVAMMVLLIFLVFYRSVWETVQTLENVWRRLSSGDAADIKLPTTRDELGQVVRSFNSVAVDLQEEKRRLALQYQIARTLAESATVNEATPKIIRSICEGLNWDEGVFWLVDEKSNILRSVELWHLPKFESGEFEAVCRNTTFEKGVGLPGRAWSSGEPVWIEDVVVDQNFPRGAAAKLKNLHGAFGFPIQLGNKVLGILEFFSHEPRKSDDRLLAMFAALGSQIGQFIERKKAGEDIKEAMELAECANRAKSEFLANMSHELRTPLNGVIGMTELLINSNLAGRQIEYAQTVRRSAESLLTILNDILDLSKIEAGKLALESIPFDLQNVVEEVGMLMSARASEKNLEMIIRYSPETPRALIGDPVRIRQVLSNIVGNAVKFTTRGHVLIEARCISRINGQAALSIRVEDTGIGIDAGQSAKLFQKFTQADASTTRRFGGTGLGLAICKNIVESMHGIIKLDSVPGKGSTFTITLTLPEAAEAEAPVRAAAQDGLQNLRFLIVDDNRINRMVLTEQFAGWRLRSVAVESAMDALRELRAAAARGEPYDVALLDYQMPEMDGGTLATTIKSEAAIKNTMLVMLTSMGQHFTAERMKSTGLAALLHKPVRQSILLETLNKVWAIYTGKGSAGKSGNQLIAPTAHRASTQSSKTAIDADGLRKMKILLVEDNEVNREVAIGMLETLGCHAEIAVDGREGVNRVIREKFDAILMDCHMPVMDGYEATGEIRRLEKASGRISGIPIIAMTANAMKGDREKCIACGMDDYVSKPIRMTTLAGILSKFATDPKRSAALSTHAVAAVKIHEASVAEATHPIFDYDAALDTASGKPERLKRIVNAFMVDAPRRIQALTEAILSGDKLVAEREAHSLKGAAANLAAERFRTHAFDAECACKAGNLPAAEKIVPMLSAALNELANELKPLAS